MDERGGADGIPPAIQEKIIRNPLASHVIVKHISYWILKLVQLVLLKKFTLICSMSELLYFLIL
jgi:hypothetical protein